MWAYLKEEKKKGKSFFYIYIYTDDRHERKNPVTDVQCGEVILRKLAESAPYILLGYTDEIANMYQSDFSRMLEVVCQRKACQSQEDHSTVENYAVINEFAVTWKKYVEWYFDTLVQFGLFWFKIFWGIAAFYSIMPLFVNFSFILFLFGIFCLYRIFIRDYIRVRKFYRRGVQSFGKNWARKIMVSDTHIMTQEGNTTIRYNKKDIVQLKEKGDRIWLVMKDKTAVRMYKSAFVEGSWEWCKELFANPVKEEK